MPRMVEFPEVNVRIGEGQAEYTAIPARVGMVPMQFADGQVGEVIGATFCWEFDAAELDALFRNGGRFWHTVLTFGGPFQPQHVLLDKPDYIKE